MKKGILKKVLLFFGILIFFQVLWFGFRVYEYAHNPSDYIIHRNCMDLDKVESTQDISITQINGYSFYNFSDIYIHQNALSFKLNDETKTIDFSEYPSTWRVNYSGYDPYNRYYAEQDENSDIILAVGEKASGHCSYYTSYKTLRIKK